MDISEKQNHKAMNNLTAADLGITGDTTLARVKELLAGANANYKCPLCEKIHRVYKRKITSAMAYGLKLLVDDMIRHGDRNKAVHIEMFFKDFTGIPNSIRADIPKLRFWGLIERTKGSKGDGNPNNGYYHVTDAGFKFVLNNSVVPKYMFISNDKIVGKSESEFTSFKQALNNKFNYHETIIG